MTSNRPLLAPRQVAEIKARFLRGDSIGMCEDYGVARTIIWQIGAGRTYKDVKPLSQRAIAHIPLRPRRHWTGPRGPVAAVRGEKNANARLNDLQAFDALVRVIEGVPIGEIAEEYRVVHGTIGHIAAGRSWNWLAEMLPANYKRKLERMREESRGHRSR